MAELFDGFENVRAYIDDLLVLTKGDYDDHLEKLERVFQRLQEAGLKVNSKKSFFARSELEYLGYWITREGIKPQTKKIEAIMRIAPPRNTKEIRSFIGVINYYRDMWKSRSHLLAPLSKLVSKKTKFTWGPEQKQAFTEVKRAISREVMLSYPDFNKPFEIHTDASNYQLGAVISQDGKPIAFFSRKLNDAQTRYTTTEKELLSIVETLKEFKNILLGHKIVVYTDHKNLVHKHFNTDRVMRWRLVLEEFGPELRHIKGSNNVMADGLSRLEMMNVDKFRQVFNEFKQAEVFAKEEGKDFPTEFPISCSELENEQQKEAESATANSASILSKRSLAEDNGSTYKQESFRHSDKEYKLWTKDGKIIVPKVLQKRATEWYHRVLMHPGETRTELTIGQHFYLPNVRKMVQQVCRRCKSCQLTKKSLVQMGQLPPKDPDVTSKKRKTSSCRVKSAIARFGLNR
jgi:hypothetical protein